MMSVKTFSEQTLKSFSAGFASITQTKKDDDRGSVCSLTQKSFVL